MKSLSRNLPFTAQQLNSVRGGVRALNKRLNLYSTSMDLVSYYAKHGATLKLGSPLKSATQDAMQNGCKEGSAGSSTATATQIHTAHNEDKPAGSDVQEDDNREIPPQELVTFVGQLRSFSLTPAGKLQVLEFNKTNPVECTRCIKQNRECRHSISTLRCDSCSSTRQGCSRTGAFQIWMVLRTFKLSWDKAEEVLERGQALLRSSEAVRTSARTSVPRARKPPAVVVDTPAPVREPSRPPKRPELSGPPRADRDRKRRVVSAPDVKPEPSKRRKVEPAPELGREILPPRPSSGPEAKQVVGRDTDHTAFNTRLEAPASLFARVTATEKRLAAIEARLEMPMEPLGLERTTRQHILAELGRTISELEVNGDVQGATRRLRALQASLLENVDITPSEEGPSEGVLLDGEHAERSVLSEDIMADRAVNDDGATEAMVASTLNEISST
ncbi:hypothetical protein B0H17DRAFT_495540 [Mycena rosella]|uniref:Uncharacterized protein n=1 Tax=Mycena rosella TaxID=1033263 RepID=A0AAD7FU63_MYCRO|nr:hypothetical protein B0H17DRAFT_495540 [Mycena rosella]